MATQEKLSAIGGHPEGSKPQQPFGVNNSYLNARNLTGSPTPGTNPIPFNLFSGGSTSQMPTSPPFNPFATCGPTSGIGGGYNPMSFGMPPYKNFGVNPGMPNFSYGWNGGFPYTQYPTPSNGGSRSNNSGHNGNGGNSGNNNGGNNNNGDNLNGSNAANGPSVFQFPDTSLQHLKYEGHTHPSKHLALFLNNENSWPMIKEQFLDRFQILRNPSAIYKALRGDPTPKETLKSKVETIEKLTTKIERMIIQLNERRDVKEKQSKKTCCFLPQNKPNPRYKGKSEEGSKNVNYQATNEDDIPLILCPRYMTWGYDAKNCPHKDFKGVVCMQCGPNDHKTKDCPRNGKTSNLFSRTPNNDKNYNVNILHEIQQEDACKIGRHGLSKTQNGEESILAY
eukprot:Gb_17479 [translate_table: standard]